MNYDIPLQFIQRLNYRSGTFYRAIRLARKRNLKFIVETGTLRPSTIDPNDISLQWAGDGCATLVLANYAQEVGGWVFSCDNNKANVEYAKIHTEDLRVDCIYQDSVEFLKQFPFQIDFLYLDSCDYDPNNPLTSQQHNLNEIKAAYDKFKQNSVIMIDDTHQLDQGKHVLSHQFLLNNGWKVDTFCVQAIYIRNNY